MIFFIYLAYPSPSKPPYPLELPPQGEEKGMFEFGGDVKLVSFINFQFQDFVNY